MKSTHNGNEEEKPQLGWVAASARIEKSLSVFQNEEKHMRDEENTALKNSQHSSPYIFVMNNIATILIFVRYLISIETIISISLSVVLTVVLYHRTEGSTSFDGGIMSWTLLSFAIITPLSSSINMAFGRREKGLQSIKTIKSYLFGIYQAHCFWDWGKLPTTGREKSKMNWLNDSDAVLKEIIGIADELCRFITLPTMSRARHRMLYCHRENVQSTRLVSKKLLNSLYTRINRLSLRCEVLKLEGMPPNEATRIRQWELIIVKEINSLEYIKDYRTPQALRSLCRIFSVIMPPFYAPFYAQLARDLNSLAMGVAFSIMTSLVLTALFECATQMEDPFVAQFTLDGIDVGKELRGDCFEELTYQRNFMFFPDEGKGDLKKELMSIDPDIVTGVSSLNADLEAGIEMK
mmetsp:Transcript_34249/g.41956  ORF Transcript_34249/g.41956 Transcript_34249/m.41956 type:complete len:407 (-) Transcript_34249:187-1407(-)|eukprot:CAMPEP_0172481450 /NCGR_PEP_ID=MMETSP1066-20121228/7296_1 /TAXON_ID=671091 /ORGANISM="Coscinodiscus wailesii, Strain CCMP2513" /LENGTH=406 /DNA_ID=CAMNT_0013243733 /DNA_START=48 /DNA_END=1268 /DNA_ORIENTATION=+